MQNAPVVPPQAAPSTQEQDARRERQREYNRRHYQRVKQRAYKQRAYMKKYRAKMKSKAAAESVKIITIGAVRLSINREQAKALVTELLAMFLK